MEIGGIYRGNGEASFTVWGPLAHTVAVHIVAPQQALIPMARDGRGYWRATVHSLQPGARYFYRIDETRDRPDPASDFQPDDVHQSSELIDHTAFTWQDSLWRGPVLADLVIYELHTGTFTPDGTFTAIIPHLDRLKELGINAIELMPVAQFPGKRNWGYDGAYPFAVQNSYGRPEHLKELVDQCHRRGIAVILDVVYNHFGPEGCYVKEFGPYTTKNYSTPWGEAVNFDDAHNDGVRNYFIENARRWITAYHIDALRLDAVHSIKDLSARPFLQELAENIETLGDSSPRRFFLIAESDLNDARIIRPRQLGGFAIDAQWADDFHHALHTLLTGQADGYYADFGSVGQLAKSFREAFIYTGGYSAYRKRPHGNSTEGLVNRQFVVFAQNHDQIGNRMRGERLSSLVSFEALKLAAAAVLLSPFIPLIFMGEEYAEDAPFQYFVDHADPALNEAVSRGRKNEFKDFDWSGAFPEPSDPATFLRSRLGLDKAAGGKHAVFSAYFRRLLALRRGMAALAVTDRYHIECVPFERARLLTVHRWAGNASAFCIFNFNRSPVTAHLPVPPGAWETALDSSDTLWGGPGATAVPRGYSPLALNPESVVMLTQEA